MPIKEIITERYAIYNGDCVEIMSQLAENSVSLSVHSPPFCGLYNYSSDEHDLSNCNTYQEFFRHYEFCVRELARITKPGRHACVHVMDVPGDGHGENARMGCGANAGTGLIDFPGDVIRLYHAQGFKYNGRRAIWKEPLGVRLRTMAKGLAHAQIVEDSAMVDVASADYLLDFVKHGENQVPIEHPVGLLEYYGERKVPHELLSYKGYKGKQTENRYSHWIWRQYASSFWDDIRIDNVLPYKESTAPDDEKHNHPLQLDVIERCVQLWSNPGEVVLTPFMGVGSEVYQAVKSGRKAIGIELLEKYFRQAEANLKMVDDKNQSELPI